MDNLVSILIPVYNREKVIVETVKSAMNQSYKNIEIIIVDNHSEDNTWSIINRLSKEDERIKCYKNNTNIGPILNWQICFDKAKGKYGKILWSDDLISPDFLEKTIEILKRNTDVAFIMTNIKSIDNNGDYTNYPMELNKTGKIESKEYIKEVLLDEKIYPFSPGCALFRMDDLKHNFVVDILNNAGQNARQHAVGNDLLLFLVTANQYQYCYFLNEYLSWFRAHGDSISIQAGSNKLVLLYYVAKAFFVQNYLKDKKLSKMFNVRLFFDLHKNKENNLCLKTVKDFYYGDYKVQFDYIYILKRIYKKIIRLMRVNN